jgi:multidrug resistance efflux pump
VAEAEARIAEIDADIRYFEPKLARARGMAAGTVSVVEMEQWQRDLEAARARRLAAQASLERLKVVLSKTEIHAPIDGTVIGRHCEPGQMIEPVGRLVTIADLSQCRLEAEVSEFDADGLVVGASATVTAEGYAGQRWRARVEEIPDVVAARKLRPQDPGRPSDTGVLLVKLVFLDPVPFKLGQRVDATIEVPKKAEVATVR